MKAGWEMKKLGDVCEVIAGQSPKSEFYNDKEKGLPFYQGKKEFQDKFIGNPKKWTSKTTKEAITNDILMSVRAPVGPVNFATQRCCIGRGLAAIRCSNKINKDYNFYYLQSKEDELERNNGAVFNSINKTQIGNIQIPIPPLAEQKQIVKLLDSAFEKIDQAKANLEKNIANAKELFQSKLNEVFSQRGDGWEEKKLREVTSKIGSGATPKGGKSSYKASGISLIRSLNVYDDGFRPKKLAFIDDKQANKLKNVILEKGDVLLNITGASVARCCIAPENYLPARVNQHVSIIRIKDNLIQPHFLHFSLISHKNKKLLLGIGEQGATRQAITKSQIQNFKIRFPLDLKIQEKLVSKIVLVKKEIKELNISYNTKLQNLEELKKSLLQKAFSGELV